MTKKRVRQERGAVFVEFVLVVPFFLMMIFLIISLGVMLSFRQTMSQAAAEGARAAAVAPSNSTFAERQEEAIDAIEEAFAGQVGGALTCGTKLVCTIPTVPVTCGDANECISVKLTYAYRQNPRVAVPLFGILLPQSLAYTASARID
jgi:Flp pilus assembly protein TadG